MLAIIGLSTPPEKPQECPTQMPVSYFGANYQDSVCIDGYLWDEDSGEGDGLTSGGDIPCPFCKPQEHLEYKGLEEEHELICADCGGALTDLRWAETNKPSVKLYGRCESCGCNQWACLKLKESDHD